MMALLPMVASADDSGICGKGDGEVADNVKWTYVESTHTLTISGNGKMFDYVPYSEDDPWFISTPWDNYKGNIQNLVVQSGVTSIGGLMNCNNLTSVSLPNTIEVIQAFAFYGCAFSSITIPNSVKNIRFDAFAGCANLKSLTIPKSVTDIGRFIIRGCDNLESIQVESGNSVYDSRNNCNAIIRQEFDYYDAVNGVDVDKITLLAGCKNTVIPDGVTLIDHCAFSGSNITSITIPQSVNTIYYGALGGNNLSAVYCNAARVPGLSNGSLRYYATLGSVENATLYVPSNLVDQYKNDLYWGKFKAILPIESSSDPKCATPTIKVENGVLKFECATEGVEFHYSYTVSSCSFSGSSDKGDSGVLLPTVTISVYASKSGYSLSDTATLTTNLSNGSGKLGDLNGDGEVNVADHVALSSIIMNQNK